MRAHKFSLTPPWDFFLLAFLMSIPLWVLGFLVKTPESVKVELPVSALIAFIPAAAASILVYRREGMDGVRQLFRRAVDIRKIKNKAWLLPPLLLPPLIYFLAYWIMRLSGADLPDPEFSIPSILVFLIVFFFAGIGEELGWMGYAVDPLQNRWGVLRAAVILGLVWAAFHIFGDIQNGRTVEWICWQRLAGVALRILIVWVYNQSGGSVFTAILFHVTDNLSWVMFPNFGSHYNPMINAVLLWMSAGVVIMVNRKRFMRKSGKG